ncbi:MAG: hypothetical protein JSU73_01190 [candidate division WOR-3 bacterium]|nr:MAG: hypothetical protein JSU73_01190 [candidate division WOR-3 bacterium]
MMYHDEVISELWRIRDAYGAENHHNLKEIVADLEKRQLQPHGTLVDRRPVRGAEATTDTAPRTRQE